MLLVLIGGCLLSNLAERWTSQRLQAKKIAKAIREWPELEVIHPRARVYLTAEQCLIGEGGDLFLFMTRSTEEALDLVLQERRAAEARAIGILQRKGEA